MIEAYKIGVSLLLDSNLSELGRLVEAMRTLDTVTEKVKTNTAAIAGSLQAMSRQESPLRTLAMTMERLADATARAQRNAAAVGDLGPKMASSAEAAAGAWERAAAAMGAVGRASGGGGRGGGPPYSPGGAVVPFDGHDEPFGAPIPLGGGRGPHPDLAGTSMVTGAAAFGGWEILKSIFEAGGNRDALLTNLAQTLWSPQQISQALTSATNIQRDIPGATINSGLTVMRDLSRLFRKQDGTPDADAIMEAAPGLMRMGVVLNSVGKGSDTDELMNAIQAGELKGKLSPERLSQFLTQIENAAIMTGGAVGPKQILQALKSGGLGVATMSDESMFTDFLATIMSMGAAGAGTGEQGFFRQNVLGRISKPTEKMMESMGLIADPTKMRYLGKEQYRLLPGALAGDDIAQSSPGEWVRKVLIPKLHEYDMKTYGTDSPELQEKSAGMLSQNIPGGKFLGDMIRLIELSEKYRNGAGAQAQSDAYGKEVAGNPLLQQQAVSAAFNGFLQAMANPDVMKEMVGFLKDATDLLNKFADIAKAHPGAMKDALETVATLAALSGGISVLTGALFAFKTVSGVLEWIGGMSGLRGLAAALELFGAGTLAATGLLGLAAGIGAILAALASAKWLYDWVKGEGWLGPPAAPGTEGHPNGVPPTAPRFGPQIMPSPSQAPGLLQRQGYQVPQGSTVHVSPVIYMDGHLLTTLIANRMADAASAPAMGPTGYDVSVTPLHTSHLVAL